MESTDLVKSKWPRLATMGLVGWFSMAVLVGLSGFYYGLPAFAVGATNATLITLSLLAIYFIPTLRDWAMSVSLKVLVLYHIVRFVGIAFLVLHAKGIIPGAFAITAGWGDIAVAVTALTVAFLALPITSLNKWRVVLVWNIFGLLDILFVLKTGVQLGFADMSQMIWITDFPMSLLPTFIVPLVIVTHIVIFIRLRKLRDASNWAV